MNRLFLLAFFLFLQLILNLEISSAAIPVGMPWDYRIYESKVDSQKVEFKPIPTGGLKLHREFKGYIEYRTHFNLIDGKLDEPLGIYLGQVGDVDKVFLNGTLIGQTGEFPPFYSNNMDVVREYHIPSSLIINLDVNEIIIVTYVEYFVQKGLNLSDVSIGLHRKLQQRKYSKDILEYSTRIVIPFICLVLAILSFPWIATNKIKGQGFLFLLAISGIIFGICRSRVLFHYFETLNVYKLNLVSSISAVMFIFLYAKEISLKKRQYLKVLSFVIPFVFIVTIALQSDLTQTALIAKTWYFVEAVMVLLFTLHVYSNEGFSRWHKLGFLTLFIFMTNDVLRDFRLISTPPFISYRFRGLCKCSYNWTNI